MLVLLIECHRMKTFFLDNSNLLEGKEAIEVLFKTLMSNEICKSFGDEKIIITFGLIDNPKGEYAYQQNILINNNTTFEEFWEQVGPFIQDKYIQGT